MSTTQSNNSSKEPNAGLPEWAIEMLTRRTPPSDLGLWYPPEDPDKPSLPYVPSFSTQIHRHVPPPSFFECYDAGKEPRPQLSEEYLKTVTQSKAIVDNPPIETCSSVQPETAQLTVTAPLSIGASRGPQVVSCSVTRQIKTEGEVKLVETFNAAAKIFDPLYYSFRRKIGNYPRDCTYEAEEDYSVEAAAYEALRQAGQTGSFAPEYYGCWTFSLPINIDGNHYTRPIRLILVEQLNGTSISGTRIQNDPDKDMGKDSFHYPEAYRLEVLARAMEGYARQLSLGINQKDFAGRNVMLVTPNASVKEEADIISGLRMPRVVLIDYNQAHLYKISSNLLPISPVEVFWNGCLWEDFGGWVPLEWEDNTPMREWLLRKFYSDGKRYNYMSLPASLVEETELLVAARSD